MNRLRVVPSKPASPEQQWLALSAEIDRLEARAKVLRAERQGLKAGIMAGLRSWGMSDAQVTAAVGGR